MDCPRCDGQLTEKEFTTHYGLRLVLDRCEKCGGFWTDKLEAHSLKPSHVEGLQRQFPDEERPVLDPEPYLCPKDRERLREGRNIIHGFKYRLDYCPKCGGIWFDPGELLAFKKFQLKKIEAMELARKEEILKKWEAERKKGEFVRFLEDLNRPVGVEGDLPQFSTKTARDTYNLAANLVPLLLETLFRGLFR